MNSAPFHQSDRGARLERPSLMRALHPRASQSPISNDQSSIFNGSPTPAPAGQARQMDLYIQKPHPILTASDLAPDWELSETQIFRLIEEGKILAFFINAEDAPQNFHYRIVRHATARSQTLTVAGMVEVVASVDTWLFPAERWGRQQNFRVDHAGEILDVSARHIRKLYDAGQLGAKNLGAGSRELSLRIPRPEITAFVQRRLKLTNNL